MVNITCNKGNVSLDVEGNISEISADILTVIHALFREMFQKNTIKAVLFRTMVETNISTAFDLTDRDMANILEQEVSEDE